MTGRIHLRPLVESLESREFLAAAPLNVLGTYGGTLRTGPGSPGIFHDVVLTISSEDRKGALIGSADIRGLGTFNVTGRVGKVKIRLTLGDGGTLLGTVAGKGQTIKGAFSDDGASGRINLTRLTAAAITTPSNQLNPSNSNPNNQASSPANNIGTGMGTSFDTGVGTSTGFFSSGSSVFDRGLNPADPGVFNTGVSAGVNTGSLFAPTFSPTAGGIFNTGTGFSTSRNLGVIDTGSFITGTGTNLVATAPSFNAIFGTNGAFGF